MNIHINLEYIKLDDLEFSSELLLAIPFLNDIAFEKVTTSYGYWNHGLYNKLFFTGHSIIKLSNIQDCDYVGLPFKYNPNDNRVIEICDQAKIYDKKVIAFYNDDNEFKFSLPDNLILFRTSISRSNILENERVFPALIPDDCIFTEECSESIGFCGVYNSNRKDTLEKIENIFPVNKIIRSGFWSPELPKFKAKREFCSNMIENKYTFCMRGNGNFSYRFYESLCFGRVPIVINTDTILPLENIINWNDYIIMINFDEIEKLPEIISSKNFNLKSNRELWETYFSPHGFLKNIKIYLN
jgi:hypothetical protein